MTIDALPECLPIFPLTGQLLLPGNAMPLHIFEPRYRTMVDDALAGETMIGMIQPLMPARDNQGEPGSDESPDPEVYRVGCAGTIERFRRLADGRLLIVLRGVCRFRIADELAPSRGYRRVTPSWSEFAGDLEPAREIESAISLIRSVDNFAAASGLNLDTARLEGLTSQQLIDGLAAALPFEPVEKQALLEAVDLDRRLELLTSLLAMAAAASLDPESKGLEN